MKTIDNNSIGCTGCGACAVVCPTKCISFENNKDGFYYPTVDKAKCIECGKCLSVCAVAAKSIEGVADNEQQAYAAVTKNIDTWYASSSGGAFSEICNSINELANGNKILFCGCAYNGLFIEHKCVYRIEDIGNFRKSKYVQSFMGNCFGEIKKMLIEGGYAVFSGTPCQVYALRKYLGREYERLYCVDLICHGVGSPGVFERCIDNEEKRVNKHVIAYEFRAKPPRKRTVVRYTSKYTYSDKKNKYIAYDSYSRLFLNQVCLRESCGENCRFRNQNRQGDITIADFNEKTVALPRINDFKNYSTIVCNNAKGRKVVAELRKRMDIYCCSLDIIKKYNPLFYRRTNENMQRKAFFEQYRAGKSIDCLVTEFGYIPPKGYKWIIENMPYSIKRFIYSLVGGLKNGSK